MSLCWNGLSESPCSLEHANPDSAIISRLLPLEVVTLVEKLLRMDRHARPSATEAMEDSYFSSEPLPRPPE